MGPADRPEHPDRSDLGRIGEDAALAEYTARGFRSVARNWRCTLGEIDLVVARGSLLVVCEVKARRTGAFGGPFDAVTVAKQRKLRALAGAFLQAMPHHEGIGAFDVRFDVASVTMASGQPLVHVFEDAF
jgi:putative endonuclease